MLSHKINYILNIGRVYDIGWAVEPKTSPLDNTPAGRRGTKEYLLQAEMLTSVQLKKLRNSRFTITTNILISRYVRLPAYVYR